MHLESNQTTSLTYTAYQKLIKTVYICSYTIFKPIFASENPHLFIQQIHRFNIPGKR